MKHTEELPRVKVTKTAEEFKVVLNLPPDTKKEDVPMYSENYIIDLLKFFSGDEREEVHRKVLAAYKESLHDKMLELLVDPKDLAPGQTAGEFVKIIKEIWGD